MRHVLLAIVLASIAPAQTVVEKDAVVLGFKLHYREAGTGPTVVLLHGLGGDGSRWAPNIGPISTKFHVIALDQIGFGQSDKPMANYHTCCHSVWRCRSIGNCVGRSCSSQKIRTLL